MADDLAPTRAVGIGVHLVGTLAGIGAGIQRPCRLERLALESTIEQWFDGRDAAADNYERDFYPTRVSEENLFRSTGL